MTQQQMAGCGQKGGHGGRKWEGQTDGAGSGAGLQPCSLAHIWCPFAATARLNVITQENPCEANKIMQINVNKPMTHHKKREKMITTSNHF